MKKIIYYVTVLMIILVIPFFYSCGKDNVTSTTSTSSDCGTHRSVSYGDFNGHQSTFTSVQTGNIRVFQFSGIPFTTIDSICTKGAEPIFGGFLSYNHSITFTPSIAAEVSPLIQPYTNLGEVNLGGLRDEWSAREDVGLVQAYGNGPGTILDLRVEIKFPSYGTLALDQAHLDSANITCRMTIQYDDYKAP